MTPNEAKRLALAVFDATEANHIISDIMQRIRSHAAAGYWSLDYTLSSKYTRYVADAFRDLAWDVTILGASTLRFDWH